MTATTPLAEGADLPALPLDGWRPTLETLHRYVQVVGKVRLASTHPRNHWWQVALQPSTRGLLAPRMHAGDVLFDLELDLLAHAVVLRTDREDVVRLMLRDGLSVAAFYRDLLGALDGRGIHPELHPVPFGIGDKTPFPDDEAHATYDAQAVSRFWAALSWAADVLDEFASWSCSKASPVHVFWHSFDLAYSRFSSDRAPALPAADPVTREAYSHRVISFGFWPGDEELGAPALYSYTAPAPTGLTEARLEPPQARWRTGPSGPLALLPYDVVRSAAHPRQTALRFLESAYHAGAAASGWDVSDLATQWSPRAPAVPG